MTPDAEALLDRWLTDAARLAPEAGRELWVAEGSLLLSGWSEPHRRYHTTGHLTEMLAAIDELAPTVGLDPRATLVTRTVAWYHDLVYDPRATHGSNEHRSATKARDHLHRLGVDDVVVDAVERGVLMTVEHAATDEAWLDVVHDADLWILSAPTQRYAEYARQVREEHGHVPDDLFAAGRARILEGFVGRPRIYTTGHAHARWEPRARDNVAGELARLSQT